MVSSVRNDMEYESVSLVSFYKENIVHIHRIENLLGLNRMV